MVQDTLHAVWRIRSVEDAREAGVQSPSRLPQARNRLIRRLGGQDHAEVVLGGLPTVRSLLSSRIAP